MRKSHYASLLVPAIVAIVALAACTATNHRETSTAGGPRTTQPSPWEMTLTTEPAQPMSGQQTVFGVHVADNSGHPVDGAKVTASLVMTTMEMGKNEIQLQNQNNGDYHGTGEFTMAGPWNVVVTATKGSQTGTQTFPIVAKR